MYSDRAGPWNLAGPRRVRPPAVPLEDLPRIDIVLLSHNHYDHCDLATLGRLARRFDPFVVTPLGNGPLVRSTGIRRVEELDWWQTAATTALPVALTRAHHFSARTPFDRNRALWGGFVLTAGSKRIYFAGDTAFVPFFAEIRQRFGPPDLALLPIGAYEPRWFMHAVHMNPAEAVQAHLDLGAHESIGMHFGTFQLTAEGIDARFVPWKKRSWRARFQRPASARSTAGRRSQSGETRRSLASRPRPRSHCASTGAVVPSPVEGEGGRLLIEADAWQRLSATITQVLESES
jgi:L-ascorbate metabolism protein UlaG (beta-lactamase superfamily)